MKHSYTKFYTIVSLCNIADLKRNDGTRSESVNTQQEML